MSTKSKNLIVEVLFNRDLQDLEEIDIEFVSDHLDRITKEKGGYWDFSTGCSAEGPVTESGYKSLCTTQKKKTIIGGVKGLRIKSVKIVKTF